MDINFTVGHAARLAAYGEGRPLKKCAISEGVTNIVAMSLWSIAAVISTNR
jgi:hypothetical protein